MKASILVTLNLFFFFTSYAQPGSLDQNFGTNGKLLINRKTIGVGSICLQQDGKILLGGNIIDTSNVNKPSGIFFTRYDSRGQIDPSFGFNGVVAQFLTPFNCHGGEAVVQKDQKIIIASFMEGYIGQSYEWGFGIVRFLKDGNIDSSFGINGLIFIPADISQINEIALQEDGDVVVGANSFKSPIVIKIKKEGIIDSAFGVNGITTCNVHHLSYSNSSMKIQPDGKIIAGGRSSDTTINYFPYFDFVIVRWNNDGSVDSSFGVNGVLTSKFDNAENNTLNAIAVSAEGKILAAGISYSYSQNFGSFAVKQFTSSGQTDSSFGKDGFAITDIDGRESDAFTMSIQSDGKILLAGYSGNTTVDHDFAFVRYQTDGSIDYSFGANGKVITNISSSDACSMLAFQSDGKIIAVGSTSIGTENYVAIVRYNNDLILPIKLFSFTASKKMNSALLAWQTASEINNSYFVIQRSSKNNYGFVEIGRVSSKGNSSQIRQYSFEDIHPLKGANYYRLKLVDGDGQFTYSNIKNINFASVLEVSLYPNPANQVLNLNFNSEKAMKAQVIISDGTGRHVLQQTLEMKNGVSEKNINIAGLKSGSYFVQIISTDVQYGLKFIKK